MAVLGQTAASARSGSSYERRRQRPGAPVSATAGDREQRVLEIIETARAKRARFRDERITLAHGAGGKATQTLIEGLLAPAFGLAELCDAGVVDGIAMTSDSFVVKPLRFPGGSIGELAVNGTVNDLAMAGAKPLAITISMILEEGLEAETLRQEVDAIAQAARAAAVPILGGDTKVVERGAADQMYLSTTGIGLVDPRAALAPHNIQPGDQVIVSGSIGEHGTAIMLARGSFELDAEMRSDTCSLWPAADALLGAASMSCTVSVTPRAAALPRSSTSWRGRRGRRYWSGRRTCRWSQWSRRRASCSESIRCTSPTRASSWPSSPLKRSTRRSARCRRRRAANGPR